MICCAVAIPCTNMWRQSPEDILVHARRFRKLENFTDVKQFNRLLLMSVERNISQS